ncbi:MAG: Rpn family recombination-promoting nuclease/putative transposase [Chthoniobacterales bacterium]
MSFPSKPENSSKESEKKIHAVHDLFFRKTMSNPRVALEFFETHLPPEIFAMLDSDSLNITKESLIDHELREYITDVLYQASFQGKEGYLYLLVEHQRTPDQSMVFRLIEYIVKIGRMHLDKGNSKLPIIYPCIIYNGAMKYDCPTNVFELCEDPDLMRRIIFKDFQLIDLSQFSDDELKKKPLLGIVEMLLKHAFTRDVIVCIQQLQELLQFAEKNNESELLQSSLSFLIHTQEDKQAVVKVFKESLSQQTTPKIMTIAEQLIAEGRQEGLRSLLEKQLNRRFPRDGKRFSHLINDADSDTLSMWIERLMDAKTIEEIFIYSTCSL